MSLKITGRTLCFLLAGALTAAAAPVLPTTAATDNTLIFEFEDGTNTGGEIYHEGWVGNTQEDGSGETFDVTDFSGTGFSWLDQKNTAVSVTVDVPKAGLYEMTIRYCEPFDTNKKVQYLNINGVNQGEVSFPYCLSFRDTSGGVVMLKEGKNTIEFKGYWGYTYFDCLTLTPAADGLETLNPTRTLSNPNASESTRRLYHYLCDQYGKHIISGQQEYCGSHNYNQWNDPDNYIKDNEAEFEYLMEKTGKMCAIRGIDFLVYRDGATWDDNAAERAAQWVTEYGGIAAISWHWSVPSKEGDNKNAAFYVESTGNTPYTTFSISRALEEGTWENKQLLADIDFIAKKFQILKDADAPVLFRPLHEAEGAWFWWGAEGPEPCKKLYRLLYDKLTNEYGLDNIIWVWTSYTYETSADWYPGDDVVDIVSYDKYNCTDGVANLSAISSTFYSLVNSTGGQKMVAMSENDSIPSLEELQNEKAAWLYFCPWYMNYLTSEQNNPVENLKAVYQSEYCITLDELPDLKTYESETPEPTTNPPITEPTQDTTVPTEAGTSYGDVDNDGDVDIMDVILLNRNLMIGTEVSAQGMLNADVDNSGEADAVDSLNILKAVVKLITLPIQ